MLAGPLCLPNAAPLPIGAYEIHGKDGFFTRKLYEPEPTARSYGARQGGGAPVAFHTPPLLISPARDYTDAGIRLALGFLDRQSSLAPALEALLDVLHVGEAHLLESLRR